MDLLSCVPSSMPIRLCVTVTLFAACLNSNLQQSSPILATTWTIGATTVLARSRAERSRVIEWSINATLLIVAAICFVILAVQ